MCRNEHCATTVLEAKLYLAPNSKTIQTCFHVAFVTVTYWYIWCDHNVHNCRNQPQLSQKKRHNCWTRTTIVATPITKVAIFLERHCVFNIDYVQNYYISSYVHQMLPHNITMRIYVMTIATMFTVVAIKHNCRKKNTIIDSNLNCRNTNYRGGNFLKNILRF